MSSGRPPPGTPGPAWADTFKVHSYEVDLRHELTLPALTRYLQEAAWRHAEELGYGLAAMRARHLAFVLARQLIHIHRQPRWGDALRLRTWPAGKDRIFCYRDFRWFDAHGMELGWAATLWFVFDLRTREPQRTDTYFHLDAGDCDRVHPGRIGKLPPPAQPEPTGRVRAGYTALDINGHVNNVSYLDWILDGFPAEFHAAHAVRELEINYLAEAFHNEDLLIQAAAQGEVTEHSIVTPDSAKEVCRARITWAPRPATELP